MLREVSDIPMKIEQFLSLEPEIQNMIVAKKGLEWGDAWEAPITDDGHWYQKGINVGPKDHYNFIEDPAPLLKRMPGIYTHSIGDKGVGPVVWQCKVGQHLYKHEKIGIAVCVCVLMNKGFLQ